MTPQEEQERLIQYVDRTNLNEFRREPLVWTIVRYEIKIRY